MAAAAPVTAPAAAVDEGSSLLSHDEQQEAFFADPTANGAAPGVMLCLTRQCSLAASRSSEAAACMTSSDLCVVLHLGCHVLR